MKSVNKWFLNCFIFIILLLIASGCKEDSNPVDADVSIQTTKNISPKDGGTLE